MREYIFLDNKQYRPTIQHNEVDLVEWLEWFHCRIDDIMCGLIEGATRDETKDALYEFVADNWVARKEFRY